MAEGDISPTGSEDMKRNIASMSGWYDAANLSIQALADIVVETTYPGMALKQFGNKGSGVATIVCTTARGTSLTVKCLVGQTTGMLPKITNITKSGTSDDLVLYFQKL